MLDSRLQMVYSLIPKGNFCDIGCDHAKLAIHAVKSGSAQFVAACDVNLGPLTTARHAVMRSGLHDKISLYLSDGLLDVPHDVLKSIRTVVIAGMGGTLISEIISQTIKRDAVFVLQPMTAHYTLLDYLFSNGFNITRQLVTRNGKKLYTALSAFYDGKKRKPDYWSGFEDTPLYREYLHIEKAKFLRNIKAMQKAASPELERLLKQQSMYEMITQKINSI